MKKKNSRPLPRAGDRLPAGWAGIITVFTIGAPAFILNLSRSAQISLPECAAGETPVAFQILPGSFVDVLPDEATGCGISPAVRLSQFTKAAWIALTMIFTTRWWCTWRKFNDGFRLFGPAWITAA